MNERATQQAMRAFLEAHSTLTLATLSADGQPMAASLYYVTDEALSVYWVSGDHSRHSRNLEQHHAAAIAVHGTTWSWTEIVGVQMEGLVRIVEAGEAWHAVWERYLAKFPFAQEFEEDVSRSNFYHFTPRWARLVDNRIAFGHKEEITF